MRALPVVVAIIVVSVSIVPRAALAQNLKGDAEAVATARRMIEAMGGAKTWSAALWIYAQERAYFADRLEPEIVDFWRSTRQPAQWASSTRPGSSAWTSSSGWRVPERIRNM